MCCSGYSGDGGEGLHGRIHVTQQGEEMENDPSDSHYCCEERQKELDVKRVDQEKENRKKSSQSSSVSLIMKRF